MKVVLLMTISPNAIVARKNDDAPWSPEEFARCSNLAKQMGNIVVGRRTYEIMKKAGDFDESIQTIVVSRTQRANVGNVTFVRSPESALVELRTKKFPIALIGGGTAINSAFLNEGLLDELILDVEPLLLGGGIPLFTEHERDFDLNLLDVNTFGERTVRLHYSFNR